jgi:hypothetical protein
LAALQQKGIVMKRLGNAALGALLVSVMVTGDAKALLYEWNLGGTGGNLSTVATFLDTTSTATLTATAINTQQPPGNPQVYQSAGGLGVNCGVGSGCGAGIRGEIDNIGDDEGMVFDIGQPFKPQSTTVGQLGFKLFFIFPVAEDYEIWATNDSSVLGCTTGGLACLKNPSTLLASGSSASQASVNIDLSGSGYYRYLIATTPPGNGDSFKVSKIVAAIPEPATIGVLGLGLIALGFATRRRRDSE